MAAEPEYVVIDLQHHMHASANKTSSQRHNETLVLLLMILVFNTVLWLRPVIEATRLQD